MPADPPTTSTTPRAERFIAREHFKESISWDVEVKISWIGGTFQQRFVHKIEESFDTTSLQIHVLQRPARDEQIIAELGDRHETMLAHLWCLLKRQSNGEQGALLTNAVPNIFYIRDADGVIGAIDVVWSGAGWEIGASSIESQRPWAAGRRIFSGR
jgi:hypothetical protein